jgi:hypothetical protein
VGQARVYKLARRVDLVVLKRVAVVELGRYSRFPSLSSIFGLRQKLLPRHKKYRRVTACSTREVMDSRLAQSSALQALHGAWTFWCRSITSSRVQLPSLLNTHQRCSLPSLSLQYRYLSWYISVRRQHGLPSLLV